MQNILSISFLSIEKLYCIEIASILDGLRLIYKKGWIIKEKHTNSFKYFIIFSKFYAV